ncbi:TonB-dependent receptor [Pedobacter montanisoli]|uniref:TonB-dependent receptor n=1 Tax=Pedobacter montanisoli TaxID=2923277 RepID=A0ABS9ZYK3_9SPHI|nr:carboxypeptidase-like regulatory domain-containing protein [Pedobacter montanisoli]MCJ0743388.1 TonB-dependent receptor [Pedobacter montanisoli]
MLSRLLILTLFTAFTLHVNAQNLIKVSGVVYDEQHKPLEKVSVSLVGLAGKTFTDANGKYEISSRLSSFTLKYSITGYKTEQIKFVEHKGALIKRDVVLKPDVKELDEVKIQNKQNRLSNSTAVSVNEIPSLPSVSGNFEAILKTLPGVSTNNELSSQYSVRGGNFDENLIYINDIEINRPVLVRNGQQEGLSLINPDFVSRAHFSAGGFSAKYGDKLSSVLDIHYDKPDSNQVIITAGLLGASATLKRSYQKGFLLFGYRFKDNSNILNTQDEKGSYRPEFHDAQLLWQQNISSKLSINTLLNFNSGRFKLVPQSRETVFGTLETPLRLKIDYEGQEIDNYNLFGGAVTAVYAINKNASLKWINSYFETIERERFDIDGAYIFDEIDNNLSSDFGTVKVNRGIGGYYNYARNSLNSRLASTELKFEKQFKKHDLSVGARFEQGTYKDDLNEYHYIDSAGYILPNNGNKLYVPNTVFTENKLTTHTFNGYIQDIYELNDKTDVQLGTRLNYNSLSGELLFSPRLLIGHKPAENKFWRFTAGIYQQVPSYRSIRTLDGELNLKQKAQRSYNFSVAYDYGFYGLGTKLTLTSEAYYKYADRMIPYAIDNIRIKYLPYDVAKGRTYGVDFSVGGEFVKDLVSYFRLSLMKADQDIIGDSYERKDANGQMITVYPGYLKRPTDQRVNFSVFFQDRLLRSPTYKVHINALYGSRLPIGSPQDKAYSDNYYIPAYRRVDIGFSKDFLDKNATHKPKALDRYFSSFTLYAEVFNLLNINNTVSYLWLKDVDNNQFAIPNYLTGRQLNLKLILKFKNQ